VKENKKTGSNRVKYMQNREKLKEKGQDTIGVENDMLQNEGKI
jgi:hypothetical protein